jgi:UDP-glucose 4-epimerase
LIGRRVLVTGVDDELGRRVAERIAAEPEVEFVIGTTRFSNATVEGVDVIRLAEGYGGLAALLTQREIDTIIHASRPWAHSASGASEHVIATMQLAAAAAHRDGTVRRVVMASTTRVYPASSQAPRLHTESERLDPRRGSMAASLVEAEGFMRDLATANPNLSAAIIRLADLAGPGTNDPLAVLLTGPVVPAAWGYDPHVQLLHIDDATAALEHAAEHELAGVYNVAADGLVRWRRAARLVGKPVIDLPPAPARLLTAFIASLYRVAADDVIDVLRFGRCAASDAFARTGFRPRFTTEQSARGSTVEASA